ncbi:MAG: hypothetical protein HY676_03215 [Chloroflexi bacterium]|nr:hypothetical protein [Chloroflexota bacterium]
MAWGYTLALSLLVVSVGCQSPVPTATPVPSPTPQPTAMPTPSPTSTPSPTPTATPNPYLGNVFESPEVGFAIGYPTEWTSNPTGGLSPVVILNGPQIFPAVFVTAGLETEQLSPAGLGEIFLAQLTPVVAGLEVISQQETRLWDGTSAYQLVLAFLSGPSRMRAKIHLLQRGTTVFVIQALSPEEEFESHLKAIDEVLRSFRLLGK